MVMASPMRTHYDQNHCLNAFGYVRGSADGNDGTVSSTAFLLRARARPPSKVT